MTSEIMKRWYLFDIVLLLVDYVFSHIKPFFSIILLCTKYKQDSLLVKSKGIITIKHGTIPIQYP